MSKPDDRDVRAVAFAVLLIFSAMILGFASLLALPVLHWMIQAAMEPPIHLVGG